MGIIYLMLVVSLFIALLFLFSFLWATKNGQFDDDHTPSIRILFDDEIIVESEQINHTENDANRKV